MDTSPRLHEDEQLPLRNPAVDVFLATLQQEQERYLASVQHAVSALRNEVGQLPCLAATHGRLTQQLFDAQRLILGRRAAVDAEVAHIARSAETNAVALVKAAQQTGSTASANAPARRALTRAQATPMETGASRTPRQEIAALGRSVVHSMADAEALARVIDDAFEADEPDGAAAQRQLTALLDGWWTAENQEGRAAVDDAHARAAMRLHIAEIHADEVSGTGVSIPPVGHSLVAEAITAEVPVITAATIDPELVAPPVLSAPANATSLRLLPARMEAVLDSADPTDLDSLLATLSASLERPRSAPSNAPANRVAPLGLSTLATPAAPVAAPAKVVDGLVIRLDRPVIDVAPVASGSEEAFRRFWAKGQTSGDPKRSVGWIPLHVVVPMAAAMSAIALLMAWIG